MKVAVRHSQLAGKIDHCPAEITHTHHVSRPNQSHTNKLYIDNRPFSVSEINNISNYIDNGKKTPQIYFLVLMNLLVNNNILY